MSPHLRVEKRKFDGSLSTVVDEALLVPAQEGTLTWFVPAGTERARPQQGVRERLTHDELWVTMAGEWWVLCAEASGASIVSLVLHAAMPVEITEPGLIAWVDLDLDFEVRGDDVALEDEAEFHRHAKTMAYPPHVIRGAWAGISRLAPRYTSHEWPFDGWLERTLARARSELAAGD